MRGRVLVVDDDPALRRALTDRLRHWGLQVDGAEDGARALEATATREYDLLLLDLAMPGLGGLDVLERLRDEGSAADVIVLTAHGSIETAVQAVRLGATDFLQKPTDFDLLRARTHQVLDHRNQGRLIQALAARVAEGTPQVIGAAPAMAELLATAARAATANTTVLVTGESGVGKQVLAEYVHACSGRRDGPFVYVNCVALADDLAESTLFGHEKGAFTGAVTKKAGRLELAAGGTAFLDEIGDTSPAVQAKLLHFLETGEYERVGGTRTLSVDCRVVAATNRNLKKAVAEGRFRGDLFYRLNVIHLEVPPLRKRPEDVPELTKAFVRQFAAEQKRRAMSIAPGTLAALQAWQWPGNVRELKNVIERMVVLAPENVLTPELLPDELAQTTVGEATVEGDLPYKEAVLAFKRAYIRRVLARARGNQTKAAQALGIQRTFLNRLIKDLGLRGEEDG